MHIMDLGITHHCLGNTLFLMCWRDRYFGAGLSAGDRLKLVWDRIEAQYEHRQTTSRMGALSLTMFTDPDRPHQKYPVLSSRAKAAESRHLVPVLASIFDDVCDIGREEDRRISAMLNGLARAYEAMESKELQLSAIELHDFRHSLDTCLLNYRLLHIAAIRAVPRQLLWNEVPKMQYTQHVSDQAERQHPRLSWCYTDEDFMNIVKVVTESCLSGTKAHRAMPKVLNKWAFGIALRLSRRL